MVILQGQCHGRTGAGHWLGKRQPPHTYQWLQQGRAHLITAERARTVAVPESDGGGGRHWGRRRGATLSPGEASSLDQGCFGEADWQVSASSGCQEGLLGMFAAGYSSRMGCMLTHDVQSPSEAPKDILVVLDA